MSEVTVITEYAKILRKYMTTFSLEAIDIAYLAKSVKRTVTAVLEEKGTLVLETQEAIANIFGLRHYEFSNPNHPLPSYKSLPEATKARIKYRAKEGVPQEITYKQSVINDRISEVLENYTSGDEFLAEEIANSILKEHEETYSVTEITDRFNKTFKDQVEKTDKKDTSKEGRGPKPVFYRVVKKVKN